LQFIGVYVEANFNFTLPANFGSSAIIESHAHSIAMQFKAKNPTISRPSLMVSFDVNTIHPKNTILFVELERALEYKILPESGILIVKPNEEKFTFILDGNMGGVHNNLAALRTHG
jgi:hypothetical protein